MSFGLLAGNILIFWPAKKDTTDLNSHSPRLESSPDHCQGLWEKIHPDVEESSEPCDPNLGPQVFIFLLVAAQGSHGLETDGHGWTSLSFTLSCVAILSTLTQAITRVHGHNLLSVLLLFMNPSIAWNVELQAYTHATFDPRP